MTAWEVGKPESCRSQVTFVRRGKKHLLCNTPICQKCLLVVVTKLLRQLCCHPLENYREKHRVYDV